MKLLKLTFGILFLVTLTSCVTALPINKQFYNSKKVGVILHVDSIGMAKAGSQGLLDMAFTPGNRFKKPLQEVAPKLKLHEIVKEEITNILNSKSKQFQFITENIDYQKLDKFDKPNMDKKYGKKDFRNLKTLNNVDEIIYIKVKYGLLVSYYGVIETGKQGYVNIGTQIVDLTDNALLQQQNIQTVASIKGNWKKGEDFVNLQSAIQAAIDESVIILKTKF
jgi:hypothetical protein